MEEFLYEKFEEIHRFVDVNKSGQYTDGTILVKLKTFEYPS